MPRGRLLAAAVGAVLLVGSAVAGAKERAPADAYPDVQVTADCGCTGAARAKGRLESGLIKTPAATASAEG